MLQRILVPVDFSPSSRAALEYAYGLASRFGSRVVVLHVWQPPYFASPDLMIARPDAAHTPILEWMKDESEKALAAFLDALAAPAGVKMERRLEPGDPWDVIRRTLGAEAFDLLVMGTHGRTGVERLLMGSVAEKVVRTSPIPVLTVRSKG